MLASHFGSSHFVAAHFASRHFRPELDQEIQQTPLGGGPNPIIEAFEAFENELLQAKLEEILHGESIDEKSISDDLAKQIEESVIDAEVKPFVQFNLLKTLTFDDIHLLLKGLVSPGVSRRSIILLLLMMYD